MIIFLIFLKHLLLHSLFLKSLNPQQFQQVDFFNHVSQLSRKPVGIPIFSEAPSVSKTIIYTEPPTWTSTFKSHTKKNRSLDILGNTSDLGPNVDIGENVSQLHVFALEFTSTPSVINNGEEEILMKDDAESNDEFVANDFVFPVESDHDDDDDAPMTKGDFRKLNNKLDDVISLYSTFINTKSEELIYSHQETIQKLVKENVDKLSQHKKLVDDSAKIVKEASLQVSTILTKVIYNRIQARCFHDFISNIF